MALDINLIRDALYDWAAAVVAAVGSTAQVKFQSEDGPRPEPPFVVLNIMGPRMTGGSDYQSPDSPVDQTFHQQGMREFTISVSAYAENDSLTLATALHTSLNNPLYFEQLAAADIGVGAVNQVNDLSQFLETRWERRSQFDFMIFSAVDEEYTGATIETVEYENDILAKYSNRNGSLEGWVEVEDPNNVFDMTKDGNALKLEATNPPGGSLGRWMYRTPASLAWVDYSMQFNFDGSVLKPWEIWFGLRINEAGGGFGIYHYLDPAQDGYFHALGGGWQDYYFAEEVYLQYGDLIYSEITGTGDNTQAKVYVNGALKFWIGRPIIHYDAGSIRFGFKSHPVLPQPTMNLLFSNIVVR